MVSARELADHPNARGYSIGDLYCGASPDYRGQPPAMPVDARWRVGRRKHCGKESRPALDWLRLLQIT